MDTRNNITTVLATGGTIRGARPVGVGVGADMVDLPTMLRKTSKSRIRE